MSFFIFKMKPAWIHPLAAILVAGAVHAATVETPLELQLDTDLDGDGRADAVIVDKVSGAFRVGYQTAPGILTWAEARATGVQEVTGVNSGRFALPDPRCPRRRLSRREPANAV